MNRRGFIGALAALVPASRASLPLVAAEPAMVAGVAGSAALADIRDDIMNSLKTTFDEIRDGTLKITLDELREDLDDPPSCSVAAQMREHNIFEEIA